MPDLVEETWVYLGRRFHYGSGTLRYVWRDPAGDEKWFKKSFPCAVGALYTATVTREEDGVTLHGSPKWTGDTVEEDEKVALVAKDWQAYREKDFRAREKRADALPELDRVVDEIIDLIRDWDDVSVVMGLVRNRVDKALLARERAKIRAKKEKE